MDYIDKFFKEKEKLENTTIEVYKYSFDITMTNNEKFQMTSGYWVTYNFRRYTEDNIFNNDSIKVDNEILNPQNIVEVEFIGVEKKFIKPIVNRFFGGEFSIERIYNNKEVKEREVC